ncbi:MAG: hypothetical protein KTR15_10465 [Phycisphaeraceae bacterium]|nr:hypothetical protein [Phycisphaeraceae bacterium]
MRIIPCRRRCKRWLVALAIAVALPLLGYALWSPGMQITDGRHDRSANGIWMSHRWLGDDAWFTDNKREHLRDQYRDAGYIEAELSALAQRGIVDLFPHLTPTRPSGVLPGRDDAQLARFLDIAEQNNQRVIPWVGGVFELHCHPGSAKWRAAFIQSIITLLDDHPRLAGVQLNIEPWPSGDPDCLLLLEELKQALPEDAVLSVAAYPPPTRWQPSSEVHWDEAYFRGVARRCDHLAVMMYDTSIPFEKPYAALMAKWTRQVIDWSEGTPLLLGLPCYEDTDVGYHHPDVENLSNALHGIHAGLDQAGPPGHYRGVALYSLWTMDPQEWATLDRSFLGPKTE